VKKGPFLALSFLALAAFLSCQKPYSDFQPGEATEFQGVRLTPMNLQQSNALIGPQYLDRQTYSLGVDGQVERPLTLTYDNLLSFPMHSRLIVFHCVEGWDFTAKWTGPRLLDVVAGTGLKPNVNTVVFHTADYDRGFTSLPFDYVRSQNVILALKINDLTLPQERGFPFQVAADGKFGYKWAKWVNHIELSGDPTFKGAWEAAGYNNDGDINGPVLDPNRNR
jgi:DMSO/TMAO reductase YedYZ molybdopterin-dependent catalytic subunit